MSSIALVLVIVLFTFYPQAPQDHNKKYRVLFFCLPFIAYFFSSFYAYDLREAGSFILRVSPLLLIPVLFYFRMPDSMPESKVLASRFTYGTALSGFFALLLGGFAFLRSGDPEVLTYYELAETISLHPTYLSLYVLTALIFLHTQRFHEVFRLMATILFVGLIFLLQSRIAQALFLILSLIYLIVLVRNKRLPQLLLICLVIVVTVWIVSKNDRMSLDVNVLWANNSSPIGTTEENGISQRAWLWSQAYNQISEKPIFGHGLRSQRSLFRWKVHQESLRKGDSYVLSEAAWRVSGLNLHNQYLQFLYDSGLIGLLLLIGTLLLILISAARQRNIQVMLATLIFSIMMLTENLLDRQMGIYYFSVFLPMLMLSRRSNKILKSDEVQEENA